MKKQNFRHGLSKPFIDALNSEYEKSGWWKRIVDDEDLFIGIRKNYLNVYFNGGSILELRHTGGRLTGKTHFKYLIDLTIDDKDSDYIKFSDGKFRPVTIKEPYRDILENIEGIKQSTRLYQGDEKKGVHQISIHNANVIDTEIQIPGENLRVDFAALRKVNDEIRIVFYEAKLFVNDDLRSEGRPNVLSQISSYQEVLSRRSDEIRESYKLVCRNISRMHGWGNRRSGLFAEAEACNLIVDPEVRLAIFQFDKAQRDDAKGENGIFTRLRDVLGRKRVLATGNPKEFKTGIKSPE